MEMWDREMQDSWRWLWGIVRGAFCRHMGNADLMLGKLEASWSILQDKREGLTTHFYEQLFNMAPHLESLFTKPQAMQHVMLQKALDMLVSGVRDPSVLQEEVKAIALRHIKYDITREDFTVFGEVLIGALRNAAGPCDWDDETEKAWHDIYSHTTQAFRHVLSSGKNLVCQALLSCCTKQLRHALESTPRGQRIQAVLEIQIDDRTMSPITWSVVEGHTHLTELLLEDVLAIRSDRNCYYYGRSALWKACPWLMPLLVEKAPKVLPVLLDGHLWCSRFVECGTRRVNYYIKEMYGNPHIPEQAVVFNSPLAILVHKLPMTELHTFSHPVITFLVNLKWRLFAKQWFISTQVLNIMNLASSTMFLHYGQNNTTASFALGLVTVTIAMLRLVLHVVVICQQIRTSSGSRVLNNRLLVPYALMDWYVILNIGSAVMCAVLFCFSFVADPFGWQALVKGQDASSLSPEQMLTRAERDLMRIWAQLAAFTTFMLWIEATEVFKLSTKLSALSYALIAVLSEVMRYMAFMALWVFGFGMTMYWLFVADINNYEYNTAPANRQDALKLNQELIHEDLTGTLYSSSLLYVLLLASLGFADIDLVIKSSWIVRAMFGLCVFATSVVLLNLLVAAMVTAYDYLQKNCDDLAMQCRAELVLRAEETMRIGRRIAIFDSLGMDEPCEFDTGDNGPSGAVQVREKIDSLSHPAFENLDRVQRFSGTTNPDAPWDPSKCHTQHRTRRTRSSGNVANNLECLETTIQTQMAYIQQELFRMQQGANDSMDSGCDQDGFSPKPDDLRIDIGDRGLELGCAKGNGNSRTNMTGSSLRASDDDALEDHESGRQERREVSAEELADHDTEESLWVAIDGEVYDITSLLAFHPGGRKLLLVTGGTDITRTFMTTHKGPSLTAASGVLRSMQHIGKYMPMQ